jgi:peptide-methionine (S)-S-oxide reductase
MGCLTRLRGRAKLVSFALAHSALGVLLLLAATALPACSSYAAGQPLAVPPPVFDSPKAPGPPQTAVLAGGCFWGVQGVFEHLTGVRRVVSGYAGGDSANAHYEIVGTGRSGHAESVEITYDPQQVSYGEILQVFFSVAHDPTQLNGQEPDVGSQYRSSIFFAGETQQKIATDYIAQLTKAAVFHAPIVTRVDPLKGFYPAEDYHQDYLLHNPQNPYIAFNDLPKIQNFQRLLPELYRGTPVTLASAAH